MSIQIIESQLEKFLSDDTAAVLAICGKWGVGKTYFWNSTIQRLAISAESFSLPRYGYVSLFGIGSLEGLKSELFTAIVDRELIGKNLADTETIQKNKISSLKAAGKKISGVLGPKLADLALRNSASIAESFCFASIHSSVICIDDLERRSRLLDLKDVLGLASLLKEQKKCKVVFLLNDGEDDLEDFKKYHEKVVDLKLRFEPTAKECTKIAIPGDSAELTLLRECICKLNITNIRTIKKIERVVRMALPLLVEFDTEITNQAIQSIVLFGWSHYRAENSDIPPIEYVTRSSYARLGLGESDEISSEEEQWNTILNSYGYRFTDDLDRALVKGVTDGYFHEDELQNAASENHASIVATRSSNTFNDAWVLYRETFSDNQDEVVTTLFQNFKENSKYIPVASLDGMVGLFRNLGEDEKADNAIKLFIDSHDLESGVFDLSSYSFAGDITDEKIRDQFNKIHAETLTQETLVEVLSRITEHDSWNPSDEVFLAESSVEDYYQLFKTESGEQLPKYVNRCLQFSRYANANDQQVQIGKNAKAALKRIAAESTLNRLRVKMYGVSVDD